MPSLEEESDSKLILHKAEEIQRLAYEEGFSSGEKAGFTHGEQKALVLIDRLESIFEELVEFRENFVKNLESQVVDLAGAVAKKIIVEDISTKPEIIVTMVKEALLRLQRLGTITIKINPSLHEMFKKKRPELLDIHPDIVFDISSQVPVTAPLVISETEEVVTDIDALLANVMEEMKRIMSNERLLISN
jgi:flagellar biosynthesis/type III secretory pathway protein FliH